MNSIHSPEFARNYGFWNEQEQAALMAARVAIAGVGGDGYQLGLKLARKGVQRFNIADPEVFEPENINRVPGATQRTLGRAKAEVFAEEVRDINPNADIRIYRDGVTADNVEDFLHDATLSYDESELTHMQIGTALAREARRRRIPNVLVMNIGFAAQVTSFKPYGKHTFERFMGIPKDMPLHEVADLNVDLSRCVPYLPSYGDMNTLLAVQNDEDAPLPSIAEGVDIASAIGASQGFLHIVKDIGNNRPEPVWAPKVAFIDSYNFKSGITRTPRLSHLRRGMRMALENKLNRTPKASFTSQERAKRAAEHAQSL